MVERDDPLVQAMREKMKSLADAGWEAYRDMQSLRAAELYRKAMELAETIHDPSASIWYRHRYATFLSGASKLSQALSVLTPILRIGIEGGDNDKLYRSMTIYVAIAQALPVSLKAVEKAYQQPERFLRDSGNLAWRHMLLLVQSMLLRWRGMPQEALAVAQESWAIWKPEHPRFIADAHLDQLVRVSLQLRIAEQAQTYLWEWELNDNNNIPKTREKLSCHRQSELARLEKRFDEAVDWARRAALVDDEHNSVIVRAFLCTGDQERARDELIKLLANRHSERGHDRYSIRLVWGDYHLAAARLAAGMAPVDDEFSVEFPAPDHIANPTDTRYALAHARHAYTTALKVGRWIDEKLECSWRQKEITQRLARVEAIEQRL